MRRLALMLCLLWPISALAERPPLVIPTDPDAVIELFPRGYSALVQPKQGRSLGEVVSMMTVAARTGDSQLASRAGSYLAQLKADADSVDYLRAKAFDEQHRHDFDASLATIDKLLQLNPRDADAHLAKTQILLVQGDVEQSRAACAALSLGIDATAGLACATALSLRVGDYDAAARFSDRWLQQEDPDRGALRFMLVTRAEASSRNRSPDAESWYRKALALDPGDVRTLASYGRHLYRQSRFNDLIVLLEDAPDTDTLLLLRALAAAELGLPTAQVLARDYGERMRIADAAGLDFELREKAEFLLRLKGDPRAALKLARENFRSQRDFEDVGLLQEAARQARDAEALLAVESWARDQRVDLAKAQGAR